MVLLGLDHKQFPVRHLCETASTTRGERALGLSNPCNRESTLSASIVPLFVAKLNSAQKRLDELRVEVHRYNGGLQPATSV